MSTSFIPYGFAQAHLPPPPSPPNSIPEVRVPTVRPYPATSEAFSTPLHPEHAASAIREPLTGILARAIHNGYVLELRTLDLFINKDRPKSTEGTEILRIFFPDPLKPLAEGCIIPRLEEGRIFLLLVTQANVIYRLILGTGDFQPGSGDRVVFNLLAKDEWCDEWSVPDESTTASGGVGAWTVVDEDEVVLGGRDGGIIVCSRSHRWGKDESWSAAHYRASSRLRLPSLFSRSTSEDEVASFARFDEESQTRLYALSRDSRLRVWNTENGHLEKTIDLRSTISASRDLVLRDPQTPTPTSAGIPYDTSDHAQYVQVVRHPVHASKYTHLVIAFVVSPTASPSPGTFIVYRVSASGELSLAGDRPCSTRYANAALRGFQILSPTDEGLAGWRLFTAWDVDGGLAGEVVLMDDLFQFTTFEDPGTDFAPVRDWRMVYSGLQKHAFDATVFDNSLSLDPPNAQEPFDNDDIPSAFLNQLFFPGRFSSLTLQTALDDYIGTLAGRNTLPQISAAYPTLSAKFAALIGCELAIRYSPQTGGPEVSEFRRDLKLQWLGVWARVTDLDRQARWPVNTSTIDDQVLILSRECFSSVVAQDTASFVGQLATAPNSVSDVLSAPDSIFELALPGLVERKTRQSALSILACGRCIRGALENSEFEASSPVLEALTDDLDAVLAAGIQEPIENIAGRLFDEYLDENLSDDDKASLRDEFHDLATAIEGLSTCLDLLSGKHVAKPAPEIDNLSFSGAGNALIASALQHNITVRHYMTINLLLVALLCLSELSNPNEEDDETVAFTSLIARVFSTYQRYHILNWVNEQTAEEARNVAWSRRSKQRKTRNDMLSDGLGGLRMQEEAEAELETDGFDTTYSLLHALLGDILVIPPRDESSKALELATSGFLKFYSSPDDDDDVSLEASRSSVRLAYSIFASDMPALSLELCEKYPNNAPIAYVKGHALLGVDRIDESVRCFEQAAAWTRDESIVMLSPAYLGPQGLATYYDVVSKTFDNRAVSGPVAHFGQLSLQSGKSSSSSPREIWTRVFFAYIHLRSFEDAYSIMMRVPSDLSLRRDFLSQLISAMCEANEVGRLTALGFVGIQKDVEEMLGYKARNSDPLKFPNYYKVLYTWHISRGDYRSAGEIMYLQGRRFASAGSSSKVTVFDLLAMQGRSYLAAINALTLVDERSAWISIARPPYEVRRASKRRRTTSFVPKEEFQDRPPVDLLTLDDIRAEYTLVLTRLELARHIDDFYQHGATVSPEEVVGLLVQRGMYDLAQSSATTLEVDMSDLFESLAKRCVEFSRQRDPTFTPTAAFLKTSPVTARLRGPPVALALRYLQTALSRHDSVSTNYRYRRAVAETFFELNLDKNTGWRMPQWLVSWEMERDPEGWITLALKWGWVEEGLEWSASLLREATPPELLPRRRADTTRLPWNLFDRILVAAAEGDEKDDASVQAKAKQLKLELDRRKQGLDMVTIR